MGREERTESQKGAVVLGVQSSARRQAFEAGRARIGWVGRGATESGIEAESREDQGLRAGTAPFCETVRWKQGKIIRSRLAWSRGRRAATASLPSRETVSGAIISPAGQAS